MHKVLIALAIATLGTLAIAACGTDEEAEEAKAEATEEVADAEAAIERTEETLAEGEACEEQMGDLTQRLQDLNGLLQVGLPYDQYAREIQQLSIAYNRIDFKDLEQGCVTEVGIGAEQAFRQYAKAEQVWGDCIEDFDCDIDGIDPQLQTAWTKAGASYGLAERGLDGLTGDVQDEVADLNEELDAANTELAE